MARPIIKGKTQAKPAIVPITQTEPLHTRLRPQSLSSVIGQDATVSSLMGMIESGRVPHAFLLTGPSGTGKTTIGRLIAQYQQCTVIEVDSAIYTGIDKMRELISGAKYAAMGKKPRKCFIVDECHALSKATWQTLLKAVEEPEPHVYWVFCTTEPEKVPKTIRTRCHAYDLKPVHADTISDYLEAVAKAENLTVVDEFIAIASRRAQGSVRQALVYLSMLDRVTDEQHAMGLLEAADESEDGEPITLARYLCNGGGRFVEAIRLVKKMSESNVNIESVRIVVARYAAAVMLNASSDKQAGAMANVLACFSTPFNSSEGTAPLLLALAQFYSE